MIFTNRGIYLLTLFKTIWELLTNFTLPPGISPRSVSKTAKSTFFSSTTVLRITIGFNSTKINSVQRLINYPNNKLTVELKTCQLHENTFFALFSKQNIFFCKNFFFNFLKLRLILKSNN